MSDKAEDAAYERARQVEAAQIQSGDSLERIADALERIAAVLERAQTPGDSFSSLGLLGTG